jgi:hypothetical protein
MSVADSDGRKKHPGLSHLTQFDITAIVLLVSSRVLCG